MEYEFFERNYYVGFITAMMMKDLFSKGSFVSEGWTDVRKLKKLKT